METKNAVIKNVKLGFEDHGILTAYITLDYGSLNQAFGGYGLGGPCASVFIQQVLETVGVDNWEDLKGKPIRAMSDHAKVYKIGHYIEDKWFDPSETFKSMGL